MPLTSPQSKWSGEISPESDPVDHIPAHSDAMRFDPNSPEILAVRGLVLFLAGKLPQALQHVASALRLDPEHEVASRLRKRIKDVERIKEEGNTAFKNGKLDEAVTLYAECLEVCNAPAFLTVLLILFSTAYR